MWRRSSSRKHAVVQRVTSLGSLLKDNNMMIHTHLMLALCCVSVLSDALPSLAVVELDRVSLVIGWLMREVGPHL